MQPANLNDSERLDQLRAVVGPVCAAHDLVLVDARFAMDGGRVLRVLIERAGADPAEGAGVTLTECSSVSRELSNVLDGHEDVLPAGAYRLEVGSPGLERPLFGIEDFVRFSGREAKLETRDPIAGRRRFSGTLLEVADQVVHLEQDGAPVEIPHGQIAHAHLVHRF